MRRFGFVGIVLVVLALVVGGVAYAEPAPENPPGDLTGQTGAHINRIEQLSPTRSAVFVDSPAMRREVQVQVLHPASSAGSRPSFYLLDGVSAGSESGYSESTWTQKTDIEAFFADKNVNVVLPVGGTGSFYTNWKNDDPNLGVNKWESFLAEELPALIDSAFSGNGTNVVGGVSMGALGAANLITHHPKLYTGLASYSGCLDNSESSSQDSVRLTVASKAGDATNMWGPASDPDWQKHDPSTNAETLRGKTIYVSSGTGAPGEYDNVFTPSGLQTAIEGGPLEALANTCTRLFEARLGELSIPAVFAYRNDGTHSWPYWQDALHDSWPTVKTALGM